MAASTSAAIDAVDGSTASLIVPVLLNQNGHNSQASDVVQLGATFAANEDYRAALQCYVHALAIPARKGGLATEAAIDVRLRAARIQVSLGSIPDAIQSLEGVVRSHRSSSFSLLLGHCLKASRQERNAAASYVAAIKTNPLCIDAILGAAECNVSAEELAAPAVNQFGATSTIAQQIGSIARAKCCEASGAWASAGTAWNSVAVAASRDSHVSLGSGIAIIHAFSGAAFAADRNWSSSVASFEMARTCNPSAVAGLARYPHVLVETGDRAALSKLCKEMLAINARRPEGWIAAALFWDGKEDARASSAANRAVELADNVGSVAVDPTLKLALIEALLTMRAVAEVALRASAAAADARRALDFGGVVPLSSQLRQLLVRSLLESGRLRAASSAASEAQSLIPNNARVHFLVALSKKEGQRGIDTAKSCLVAALRLDPACWDAATLLSQIYHQAGDLEASVKVMRAHLAASNTADAQCGLAKALAATSDYSEALEHFHAALAMQPGHVEAERGLEGLESSLHEEMDEEVEEGASDAGSFASP